MHSYVRLSVGLGALLLPAIHAAAVSPNKYRDEGLSNPTCLDSWLNQTYYQNFPPRAVNFRPRMQKTIPFRDPDSSEAEVLAAAEAPMATGEEKLDPSKTVPEKLVPRATFSFYCPTSIECPDAGCCPYGTWCTVVEGLFGCCDLPIGKQCLAYPNNSCAITCGDVCCDDFNGPDPNGLLAGDIECVAVPGVDLNADYDDHTPAFQCQFAAPSAAAPTPTCLGGNGILCGGECCPNNFICNKNIPGLAFCDVPTDPNLSADVTAVSQLGFNSQEFNMSVGATPASFGTNSIYTGTGVMNGTPTTTISRSITGSGSASVSGSGTGTMSASVSKAGAGEAVVKGYKVVIMEAVVAFGGVAALVAL